MFLILSPLSVVLSVVPCGEYLEDAVLLALVLKLCTKMKATDV